MYGPQYSQQQRTYRFPLDNRQQGFYRGGGGSGVSDWFSGPWGLGEGWIGPAVLAIGVVFQVALVAWFAIATNAQELDYIPPAYMLWTWLLMALILGSLAVPWFVYAEPIVSQLLGGDGASAGGLARKPLVAVLGAAVVTTLLFVSVIPSIDGNVTQHYLYTAAETSFLVGWLLGLAYVVVMAVTSPSFPLAQIGVVPAVIGAMVLVTALTGAGAAKGMMTGAGAAVAGTGPAGTGTGGTSDAPSNNPGSNSYSYEVAGGNGAPSGPDPTNACPCPNEAGTKCNCPYLADCSRSTCWNAGGGSIPGACLHGCPY